MRVQTAAFLFTATIGVLAGTARAETVEQVAPFNFPLDRRAGTGDVPSEVRGFERISFDQFDAGGGRTLDSATLELETRITGIVTLLPENDEIVPPSLDFSSNAEIGTFEFGASADFDEFDAAEGDGEPVGEGAIRFDETGEGQNTADDLSGFVGTRTLGGSVGARIDLEHAAPLPPDLFDVFEGYDGIRAEGEARLSYEFSKADDPDDPEVIPTPSAAAGGLALLSFLWIGRRRRTQPADSRAG